MSTDLAKLVELHHIDAELARLRTQLTSVTKILARLDAQLNGARQRAEEIRGELKAGDTARRKFEQEIQALNEKISKFRSQSSGVKNNEQYKALLSEIAQAEREIAGFEEKILEVMMAADSLHVQMTGAEAALKAESAEVERQKAEVEKTAATQKAAAGKAEARRNELRKDVDETLLLTYDRILHSRGSAVAEVLDSRCAACQVILRPQVISVLRIGEEIVSCDSCRRILYYVPEHNVKAIAANTSGIAHQAEREWMFVPSMGSGGAFVVFINHKGTATMKAYDASTGEAIARRVEKNAVCQQIFAEELRGARNLFVDEADLDEKYKDQLPTEVLDDLRHQLPDN